MIPLVLVAASGLAREVISSVEAGDRYTVIGLLDDDPELTGTVINTVPVLGRIDEAARFDTHALGEVEFLVCVGKGTSRRAVTERLTAAGIPADRYATVVHPSVQVPRSCTVGAGSVLLAGCVLTADITVGRHVVAMPGVVLTHDNQIADYATLCAGVTLGGSVQVGEAAYLGMSAAVRERVTIGAEATLGMGAVQIVDLPRAQTWVGNPARALRAGAPLIDDEQGE